MIRRRVHPAWTVLGAVTIAMLAASGLRSMFGAFIKPLETEFGWSRGTISGVAALSLLLLGASGPLAGRLADRWGARRLVIASLLVLGTGTVAAAGIGALWQAYALVGVVIALGAGGLGMATGSAVVARWFDAHRGLAVGLAAGGMSAGQLVVIPLATALIGALGWRQSYLWLGLGLLAVILPVCALLLRNDPADAGVAPYGGAADAAASARLGPPAAATSLAAPARRDLAGPGHRVTLTEAARSTQFWLLMATFFVCGYTSSGVVLTHFMPHALDHNFSPLEASSALGVMGAMNVGGTIASGWICDRFGRRGPLATYYILRGASLIFLLYVWDAPSLHLWAAIFGLNYISTVVPTTALTASIFGRWSVGELSGWIFFSHQVGSALGAALAGWIFEWTGSYASAFVSAAVLAFIAGFLSLCIREEPAAGRSATSPN